MAAKDEFHEEVRKALIREQWTVTEPFQLDFGGKRIETDLAAEHLIFADRKLEKIAI